MDITDSLQRQISAKLGFGNILVQEWTLDNLAAYYDLKDGILLEPMSGDEGVHKFAEALSIPREDVGVIDHGLAYEVHQRSYYFIERGEQIPFKENSLKLLEEVGKLKREAGK